MDIGLALVLAISTLAIALAMALIPGLFNRTTPLGVSVPRSKVDSSVVGQAVRNFRAIVLGVGTVAALTTFVGLAYPLVALLAPLMVLIGNLIAYLTQREKIIAAKREFGWYDDAEVSIAGQIASLTCASADTNSQQAKLLQAITTIERPRVPAPWLITSLLAVGISAAIVASRWFSIPATIATHWGPGFEPDAWADKTIGTVFVPTWISLAILLLFWLITLATSRSHVAVRNDRSIKGQLRSRAMMAATNQGLGMLGFVLAIGFGVMQVVNYLPEYQPWIRLSTLSFLMVTIFSTLLLLVPVATAITRVDNALRGLSLPDDHKDSPDNDKYYKWGMFYYNPNDPAVMVEKRFGAGMGFNYASWQGKVFTAVMVAIVVGAFVLIIVG